MTSQFAFAYHYLPHLPMTPLFIARHFPVPLPPFNLAALAAPASPLQRRSLLRLEEMRNKLNIQIVVPKAAAKKPVVRKRGRRRLKEAILMGLRERGYEWDGTARPEGRIVSLGSTGPEPAMWKGASSGTGIGEKSLAQMLQKEEDASNPVPPALEPKESKGTKADTPVFAPTSWLNDRIIRGPWSYPQIQTIAKDFPLPHPPSPTPSKPQPKPVRQSTAPPLRGTLVYWVNPATPTASWTDLRAAVNAGLDHFIQARRATDDDIRRFFSSHGLNWDRLSDVGALERVRNNLQPDRQLEADIRKVFRRGGWGVSRAERPGQGGAERFDGRGHEKGNVKRGPYGVRMVESYE